MSRDGRARPTLVPVGPKTRIGHSSAAADVGASRAVGIAHNQLGLPVTCEHRVWHQAAAHGAAQDMEPETAARAEV